MSKFEQVQQQWNAYWQFQEYIAAWNLTQCPPTKLSPIPSVTYSQAAAKATYEQRRHRPRKHSTSSHSHPTYTDIFPPLPKGPPPPRIKEEEYSPPLPVGLMKHYKPSPVFPKTSVDVLDYDNTAVKSFMDWTEGSIDCLPPNVASEVGLDLWLYELRGKQFPTAAQEASLRNRILQLANQSPFNLHQAIEQRTLKSLLGKEFEWVECPELW
jgi:hypothetical protein